VEEELKGIPELACHDLKVYRESGRLVLALHCDLEGRYTVSEAHRLTSRLEEAIRHANPAIARVQIHVEPR
jgi:divalent metal cation (Fe/Co/Zn/Cd) transporter